MADKDHVSILSRSDGVMAWNRWREDNPGVIPDLTGAKFLRIDLREADLSGANLSEALLRGANLSGADLSGANLSWAMFRGANLSAAILSTANLSRADLSGADLRDSNFWGADLSGADLSEADLSGAILRKANLSPADPLSTANLRGADLRGADLSGANLSRANLRRADLSRADLSGTNLSGANLGGADLSRADFTRADLSGANLSEANLHWTRFRGANLMGADLTATLLISCKLEDSDLTSSRVYGASIWDASLEGTTQKDIIITPNWQPSITVDNLEVAQFVYLLLNNARIREVIDTITSKAVLILGRFTPERKRTLDALRDALRAHNYLPIVFDFEKPTNRDYTETVSTLAHLARFVIADLTDPRSIPQELIAVVPRLQSVPIRPLLLGSQREWAMFRDLSHRTQVIEPFHYTDDEMLLRCLESDVIEPAERKARELAGR